jgi:hypothetical protein
MKAPLFMLALLCADSASAARTLFQVRCEETMDKPVSVLTTRESGYTVDNSRSYKSLTAMKGNAPANAYVLGLTRTESRMQISSGGPMLSDPFSGYECIAPKIEVELYYTPIVIYVGSEFAPGTCAYQEILAHEMRHLKTYLDYLPKVELVVRKALSNRFDNKPLYAQRGQAASLLQREIDTGWMPWMKREMIKVETQQAQIDTPQEYMRLSRVCKGEVQSIIGPATRTR